MLGAYNMKVEPRHVPLEVLHSVGLDPPASSSSPAQRLTSAMTRSGSRRYAAAWLVEQA